MLRSHDGVNDHCGRQIAFEKSQEIGNVSAPLKPDGPPVTVEARCVRLPAKFDDPASLALTLGRHTRSRAATGGLIEVKAAAVNPSDVKAAPGPRRYAEFPGTRGRDIGGIVIDGPVYTFGREV